MFKGKDKNVSSTFSKLLQAYKVMNFNGKELYVMGIERIIKFSAEEVVLLLKNVQKLCIYGEKLVITECDKSAIMLTGTIIMTEVE